MSRNVIITGTSSGLGKSLAVMLARNGFKVYATMRDPGKQEALLETAQKAGVTVHVKQLDVTDMQSINECVADVIAEDGCIDVLVNNAGAGFVRTTEQATEEDVRWVMDVNFHGVVRCVKAVLPHMRTAESGHVVNITSVGGLVGQPFNEIYCAAKFAVEGYTESMATYIQPNFGIKFSTVEPGGISSEFANSVMKQFQESGGMVEDPYRPILEKYISGAGERAKTDNVYQTPDVVAKVVLECIKDPDPPLRVRTSPWANEFCELKTQADPTGKKLQQAVIDQFLG